MVKMTPILIAAALATGGCQYNPYDHLPPAPPIGLPQTDRAER
jgi:hypothetical protein